MSSDIYLHLSPEVFRLLAHFLETALFHFVGLSCVYVFSLIRF